jgi:metallo-beta-lactamase family protein
MRIHFHGAAGEVTGSLHEVEAAGRRILLDCGMIQGSPEHERRNAEPFGFDVDALDALVISHAHIDHIGRVPLLVKRGFRGPIYAQAATADLMPIMLLDAASARRERCRTCEPSPPERRARNLPAVFTRRRRRSDGAGASVAVRRAHDDRARASTSPTRDAGHILGSAITELWADGKKLVFSGDLGPKGTPILRDPTPIAQADLVLMESTYGDRNHRERIETIHELGDIFERAMQERGNVLIPAFAVGRSQELLYWFAQNWDAWKLSRWHVFLDSPMAAKVIRAYEKHLDLFDEDAQRVWKGKPVPFKLPNLHISESIEDSMAINRFEGGAIIIAGSGMANGGRILHHLKHNLGRRNAHVVFPGYQAQGTLGRRLVDGAQWVRIHGKDYRVNAQRHTVGGLSAHADQRGLLEWYGHFEGAPRVALVHGEDKAREALAGEIHERYGREVFLSRPGRFIDA